MAEFIHLIDDISTPVKLGWLAVLAWGAVQFLWFQRARVEPDQIDTESAEGGWSIAGLLARFKRSQGDDVPARSGLLSIAPSMDRIRPDGSSEESDLGEAAGVALETLLENPYGNESPEQAAAPVTAAPPQRHLRSVPRPPAFSFESSETT
jgi:hypothetical protein